jgi:hypothetical protein
MIFILEEEKLHITDRAIALIRNELHRQDSDSKIMTQYSFPVTLAFLKSMNNRSSEDRINYSNTGLLFGINLTMNTEVNTCFL